MSRFKILKKDKNSWARTGVIETPHGIIETPAYAMVGTHGQIKCLPKEKIAQTKTQLVMTNTFHLWLASLKLRRSEQDFKGPGGEIENLPSVQSFFGDNMPTITDSGGFQVFSLGFGREHKVGKVVKGSTFLKIQGRILKSSEENLVKITEEGVYFGDQFLGPELSIKIQEKLGADLILAFDECTSPLHDFNYNKEAMERTHRWAKVCLETKNNPPAGGGQLLYGIVQGGEFQNLREESAKFINSLPFDGVAIGGTFEKSANGSFDVLKWTIPHLDENRPRHFLGIGLIGDIFESVELGIDSFDCVVPTREARHGGIWTKSGRLDITKSVYQNNLSKLEENCLCPTCDVVPKAELHRLFKTKNLLAGENATMHNVYFFNNLMAEIREAIKNERLPELKKEYLP
ncbi:MAG: queuine tRNA-ribosyltransferase [Parcubacteria group bacterium Gr01-1014_44]|nr:MAG: queuine tRNA-ribosyltransferase [Parcubacteria group bacterium Gr01-1014_44]